MALLLEHCSQGGQSVAIIIHFNFYWIMPLLRLSSNRVNHMGLLSYTSLACYKNHCSLFKERLCVLKGHFLKKANWMGGERDCNMQLCYDGTRKKGGEKEGEIDFCWLLSCLQNILCSNLIHLVSTGNSCVQSDTNFRLLGKATPFNGGILIFRMGRAAAPFCPSIASILLSTYFWDSPSCHFKICIFFGKRAIVFSKALHEAKNGTYQ